MQRFFGTLFCLIIISGSLSACQTTSTTVVPETPVVQPPTKPIKNNHHLEMRLQELTLAQQQLKEKIAQLERRQNDLERSIAVVADTAHQNYSVAETPDESTPLQQAQKAYTNKQYTQAVNLLNHYPQDDLQSPDIPHALWLLSNSHEKLNNCESAVRTVYQLTQRFPEYTHTPDAFLLIARCQNRLQQKDSAKSTLRSLITKYPNSRAAKKAKQLLK